MATLQGLSRLPSIERLWGNYPDLQSAENDSYTLISGTKAILLGTLQIQVWDSDEGVLGIESHDSETSFLLLASRVSFVAGGVQIKRLMFKIRPFVTGSPLRALLQTSGCYMGFRQNEQILSRA